MKSLLCIVAIYGLLENYKTNNNCQKVSLCNFFVPVRTACSMDSEQRGDNILQFTNEEFDTEFSLYWELRYGTSSKVSMFLIVLIFHFVLCFDESLTETPVQTIFTCIIIFGISLTMFYINSKETDFENFVFIPFALMCVYFIINLTLLSRMSMFVFLTYYVCLIIFGNVYIHLKHKHFRSICYSCLFIWTVLMVLNILNIFNNNNDDNNSFTFSEFMIGFMVLLFIKMSNIKGSYKTEIGRKIMFISLLNDSINNLNTTEHKNYNDNDEDNDNNLTDSRRSSIRAVKKLEKEKKQLLEMQQLHDKLEKQYKINIRSTSPTTSVMADIMQDNIDDGKGQSSDGLTFPDVDVEIDSDGETIKIRNIDGWHQRSSIKPNSSPANVADTDASSNNNGDMSSPSNIGNNPNLSVNIDEYNTSWNSNKNGGSSGNKNNNNNNNKKINITRQKTAPVHVVKHPFSRGILRKQPSVQILSVLGQTAGNASISDEDSDNDDDDNKDGDENKDKNKDKNPNTNTIHNRTRGRGHSHNLVRKISRYGSQRNVFGSKHHDDHVRVITSGDIKNLINTHDLVETQVESHHIAILETLGRAIAHVDVDDHDNEHEHDNDNDNNNDIINQGKNPILISSGTSSLQVMQGQLEASRSTSKAKYKQYLTIKQVPRWYDVYPHINNRYRFNYTILEATKSICEWHNETLNFWTEIIPSIVFFGFHFYLVQNYDWFWTLPNGSNWGFTDNYKDKRDMMKWILVPLPIINGIRCILSAIAHNYHFLGEKWTHICWSVDVISISFITNIIGAAYLTLTLYCINWNVFYTGLFIIVLFTILLCQGIVVQDSNGNYYLRLIMTVLGMFFAQFWHIATIVTSFNNEYNKIGSKQFSDGSIGVVNIFTYTSYVIGATAHTIRWPEKYFNNVSTSKKNDNDNDNDGNSGCKCKVNNFGTSHQIWHIFINLGNFFTTVEIFLFAKFRAENETC